MSDFNRTIHPDILALAEGILDAKQLELAEQLSDALLSGEEDKQHAIWHLKEIIGTSPKRPVYYLEHEIGGLPEYSTRHVVRYAGDYIDQMIKYCSYYKGGFHPLKSGLRSPLGTNLKRLDGVLPDDLLSILFRFNEVIYVPAKHEWDIPKDRDHLFSSKEAVYVCLMVKNLSALIEPYSEYCVSYNKNEQVDYFYDSSQKGRRNE